MNEQNKESRYIFSFSRWWSKVKDRWYILVLAIVIALTVTLGITLIKVLMISRNDKYYQAETSVYIDWDDDLSELTQEVQDAMTTTELNKIYTEDYQNNVKVLIEQWQKNRIENILLDCNNYLQSNSVRNEINQILYDNGYEELTGCDIIKMKSTGTSHLFKVTITGYQNEERVLLLASEIRDIIINEGNLNLGLTNCRVIDEASVYEVIKSINNMGNDVYNRKVSYPDGTKNATSSLTIKDTLFSISNRVACIFGTIIGLFITLILSLLDNRIKSIEELKVFSNVIIIGKLISNKKESYLCNAATIVCRCNYLAKKNIMCVAPGKLKSNLTINYLSKLISKNEIECDWGYDLDHNTETINKMMSKDGIILYINEDFDSLNEIEYSINRIRAMGLELLGIVYIVEKETKSLYTHYVEKPIKENRNKNDKNIFNNDISL